MLLGQMKLDVNPALCKSDDQELDNALLIWVLRKR